jgi:hypothetical protein
MAMTKVETKRRTTKRAVKRPVKLPKMIGSFKVIMHEGGERMQIGCQEHDIDTWITDGRRALSALAAVRGDARYSGSAYPCSHDGGPCGAACRLYVYLRDGAVPMAAARKLLSALERTRK